MKGTLVFAVIALACAAWLPSGSKPATESKRNAAPRESRIPVAGAELYAREVGHGTAIIVLHGGPDFDHSYLLPELDRLSDSYHLIYYDQRGRVSHLILMNPAPASEADYKQLRNEWLEKRADDMQKRKAISDTAAYKEADPDAVVAYYRIHFKPALARSEDYDKLIARMQASFIRQGNAGIIKARAVESRLMTETWSLSGYDLLPRLNSVRVPTLVISGDHEFIPISTAEHITQAIPNARMVTLKDCGHFTYLECPVAVREQIDAFFAGKSKPAR